MTVENQAQCRQARYGNSSLWSNAEGFWRPMASSVHTIYATRVHVWLDRGGLGGHEWLRKSAGRSIRRRELQGTRLDWTCCALLGPGLGNRGEGLVESRVSRGRPGPYGAKTRSGFTGVPRGWMRLTLTDLETFSETHVRSEWYVDFPRRRQRREPQGEYYFRDFVAPLCFSDCVESSPGPNMNGEPNQCPDMLPRMVSAQQPRQK